MGRMLTAAIERAALSDVLERALTGKGLDTADLARLRSADVLVVAGIADAVRAKHRGDEVRVLSPETARRAPDFINLDLDAGQAEGPTGQPLVADRGSRLSTPFTQHRMSAEQIASTRADGADVRRRRADRDLVGSKRTLPLLDGREARKTS